MYVNQAVKFKVISTPDYCSDLPTISITANKGGEKPILVNNSYREHTGGLSGLGTPDSQKDRLERQIQEWTELEARKMDMAILGDINLD